MGPASLRIGVLRPIANEQYAPAKPSQRSSSSDFKSALVDATSDRRIDRARAEKSRQSKQQDTENQHDASVDQNDAVANVEGSRDAESARESAEAGAAAAAIVVQTPVAPETLASNSSSTEGESAQVFGVPASGENNQTARADESAINSKAGAAPVGSTESADVQNDSTDPEGDVESPSNVSLRNHAEKLETSRQDEAIARRGDAAAHSEDGSAAAKRSAVDQRAEITDRVSRNEPAATSGVAVDEISSGSARAAGDETPDEGDADESTEAKQSVRRELRDGAQETRSDTRSVDESAFQEKVRRWIDGRREGPSEEAPKAVASAVGGVKTSTPRPGAQVSERPAARESDKFERLNGAARVKIAGGRGDGAAAAVSRLLIEGGDSERSDQDRASGELRMPTNTLSGVSTKGANGLTQTGSTSPGSPANVVAELLAARDESAGAVENAAKALNASGGSGRYQATMRLDPPELGSLQVQVRMNQQSMTLHVRADSEGVSRLIESRLTELRDALATHGITVERAEVVTKTPNSGESQLQQDKSHGGHAQGHRHEGSGEGSQGGWTDGRGWEGTNDGRAHDGNGRRWDGRAEPLIESAAPTELTDQLLPIGDRSVNLVA